MDDKNPTPAVGIPGSDLGWYLGVILRRWHEEVEAAVADLPNGTRGFQILSAVGHNDPPSQSGLAKHLNIDKTVMPYIVDALESAGLVERRTDSADRRVRRIAITQKGAATLRESEAKVRAAEDAVFAQTPAALRDAFVDHAARLAISLHRAEPSVDACAAVLDAITETTAVPARH